MTVAMDDDTVGGPPRRTGRNAELLVALLVTGIGAFLLHGAASMDVPDTAGFLGPRFFPTVVGVFLAALGVLLAVRTLRGGRTAADKPQQDSERIDWKPLGFVGGTLLLHLLLLDVLGWILAGALLFWGVSYALGSRRALRDLGIAFVVAAAVQLGFSAGLGLNLPAGILLGVV